MRYIADPQLDQPIDRYINEDRTIECDYSSIYVRYCSSTNSTDFTKWSQSFARVVSAYLAREIVSRINSSKYEEVNAELNARIEIAIGIGSTKEPYDRPKASTSTLSQSWLNIYNSALFNARFRKNH